MMINKRNTKIVNDKKLLHKVGKQWVTVSIAMLSMLGAGVAVHSAKAANVSSNGEKPQTNVEAAQTSQPKNIKTATPSGNNEQKSSQKSTGVVNVKPGKVTTSGNQTKRSGGTLKVAPNVTNNEDNGSQLGEEDNEYNPVYSFQAEQSPIDPNDSSKIVPIKYDMEYGHINPIVNGKTVSDSEYNSIMEDLIRDSILQRVNQVRQQYGLRPVQLDQAIQKVSQLRSKQAYEAYSTQPHKYVQEQKDGFTTDSDNYIHGHDWNDTFGQDSKRLGVSSRVTPVGEVYKRPAKDGYNMFYPSGDEFENAGPIYLSQMEGHDIFPNRFYAKKRMNPYEIGSNDVNDMVFHDHYSGNGHTFGILNPLYDEVGIGVYFFNDEPKNNTDVTDNFHNMPIDSKTEYGAIEQDFTTSPQLSQKLRHYMFTHLQPYTSKSGEPTMGCFILQPSDILWTPSDGTHQDMIASAGTIPQSGYNHLSIKLAPVISNPSNGHVMGYISQSDYLSGDVTIMPTQKSATDNSGHLWGQYKIETSHSDPSQAWMGYLPIGIDGKQRVIPDPQVPLADSNLSQQSQSNNPTSGGGTNENGTGGGSEVNPSTDGGSNSTNGGGGTAGSGAAAGGAGGGANGTAGGTVAGGNGNNNSTKAGPNNNNNNQGPDAAGHHTSNNNNPSNNVVTPSNNMINNNDHDYHGNTNQGNNDADDNDDKALIVAAGMMNNNDPHYGEVIAALKDNDMNSALARNQYAAVSEMARNMSASTAAASESTAITDEHIKAVGANSAQSLVASSEAQSVATSLENDRNWQSEAQSIVTSVQAVNASHRGQLASANAAIDAAAQNALDALNNDSDLSENLKASYADQIEAKKGSALADALHGNDLAGLSAAVNGEGQQIQAAASTMNSEDFADGLHSAQSSLDSDVNSGLNSLNANSNLTSGQKSLAVSTLNSAANVAREQFSLPTTNVSELGSLVNGMTSQTASVLSSAASQANGDMMSAESQADSTINSERAAAINSINAAPNLTEAQKSAEVSQVNSEANTEKSAVPAGGTSYADAVISDGNEPMAHASKGYIIPSPVLPGFENPSYLSSTTSKSVNPPSPAMDSRYPEPLYPGSLARSQKADSYNSNISGLPNPMSDHKVPHVTSAYSSEASSISSSSSQPLSSKSASMASSASNSSTASSSSMNSLQSAIASIESSEGIKPASNTSASGSYASSAAGTSTSSSVSSSAVSPASLTSSAASERASARSALAAQEALLKSQNRIPGNDGYYDGKGLWHWNTAGDKRQPGVNGYYDKLGNWTPVNLSKLEAEANAGDDTSNGGYYDKFGFWHPGSNTSAQSSSAVKPSSAAGQKSASASLSPKQRAIDSLVNTMTGHKAGQKRQTKPTTKRSHWQWVDNSQPIHVSGHFRGHKSAPKADVPAEGAEPATNEFLPDGTVDGLKAMNGNGDPEGVAQVPNGVSDAEAGSDQNTSGQVQNGELPQTGEPVNDTEFAFGFLMLAFGLAAFDLGKKKKQRA